MQGCLDWRGHAWALGTKGDVGCDERPLLLREFIDACYTPITTMPSPAWIQPWGDRAQDKLPT